MSFNHIGNYICECGREFTNSQSYNGHLSRCKIHLGEDRYNERNKKLFEANAIAGKKLSEKLQTEKSTKELAAAEQWAKEQHLCEHCGKVMLTKFGSGRFCSRACANSREQTDLTNWKRSLTERAADPNEWTFEAYLEYINNKPQKKEVVQKPEWEIIPDVTDKVQNRKPGFQSRTIKYSYPEQFWRSVFENNGIQYEHSVYVNNGVHTKGAAAFELDFLIDGKYDIEIDGGTHTKFEDVKEKDIRRDAYLTSLGYIVYRIPWVNPTSIEKKDIVYKQIVDLFEFLGKELITKKD